MASRPGWILNNGDMYIHRHVKNFRRTFGKVKGSEAAELYSKERDRGIREAKERYQKLYMKNLIVPQNVKKIMNSAMNKDEILSSIDSGLLDNLNQIMQQSISNFDLNAIRNNAYTSLNEFINTGDVQELNNLFKAIADASELLNVADNELYFLIYGDKGFSNTLDLTELNQQLNTKISSWEGKVISINQQQLLKVMKNVQQISSEILSGQASSQRMKNNLSNIFSTRLGEFFISNAIGTALGALDDELKDIEKTLVGNNKNVYTLDAKSKALIDKSKVVHSFKTDNKFENISIDLSELSPGHFIINLGISTKWYENLNKTGRVKTVNDSHAILKLEELINSNYKNRYFVYNTIGLAKDNSILYEGLLDALAAMNIDKFLSGVGNKGDFSQYLVINGKFYSILQIINLLDMQFKKNQKNNIFSITMNGINTITNLTTQAASEKRPSWERGIARSKEQNLLIKKLKITGFLHINKLKSLTI